VVVFDVPLYDVCDVYGRLPNDDADCDMSSRSGFLTVLNAALETDWRALQCASVMGSVPASSWRRIGVTCAGVVFATSSRFVGRQASDSAY
jgi:hypothetical protein